MYSYKRQSPSETEKYAETAHPAVLIHRADANNHKSQINQLAQEYGKNLPDGCDDVRKDLKSPYRIQSAGQDLLDQRNLLHRIQNAIDPVRIL